jgi:hypothetical protein
MRLIDAPGHIWPLQRVSRHNLTIVLDIISISNFPVKVKNCPRRKIRLINRTDFDILEESVLFVMHSFSRGERDANTPLGAYGEPKQIECFGSVTRV